MTREKAQQKRELDAQIEARKQAWRNANLAREPDLTMQREPDRQIADDNAHRLDPLREKPRDGLAWRGKPWWKQNLWPLRVALLAWLAWAIYGVICNIIQRDGITAVGFVMLLPIPVYLLLATWANKKV